MIDSAGSERQKALPFFLLSLLFCFHLLFFCWSGAPQSSKVAGWAGCCCVSQAGWKKKGALRAQQEHSIQFTGLSHMAPGAAHGALPWWSAPAAHKLCRGNKRTGQTLLKRSPALHFSLTLYPTPSHPHFNTVCRDWAALHTVNCRNI